MNRARLARTYPQGSVRLTFESDSAPESARRVRYVCMPGSPFTGSTLLGALLNRHPECASIGAATGLIQRVDLSTYRCSCGKLFRVCEFWHYIESRTRELGHPVDVFKTNFWNTHLRLSSNRLSNAILVRPLRRNALDDLRDAVVGRFSAVKRAIRDMGWNSWSLATAVLEKTGKKVFVDTARDHQRPKYLAPHPLLDLKVIHLIRDPRGNSASTMKHTGVDAVTAAKRWRHYNVEADRVKRYIPQHSWMSLRYEELCTDPAGTLDRISDFLGIQRVGVQDPTDDQEYHIIGNKLRLKGFGEIREDLSWQTRLSGSDLAHIARIAGMTSHRLGFTWP